MPAGPQILTEWNWQTYVKTFIVFICVGKLSATALVIKIRGQLAGVGALLPCGSLGWNFVAPT